MKFPISLAASVIYLLAASCAQSPQCPFQRTSDAHSLEKTAPQGISCGSRPIRSCGGNDDVMQNVKVTVSPNPPRVNSNIIVTLDATVSPLHLPVTFSPIHTISPGSYGVYANATDQDGVQIFCIYAVCTVTP